MKNMRLLMTAIVALSCFAISGTGKFEPLVDGKPKTALVSIYCSKEVNASDFTGMAAMITKLADSEEFQLDDIAQLLHDKITNEYLENLEFNFIPEEDVLKKEGYDESLTDGALIKADWMVKPEGYVGIHTASKKSQKNTLELFKNVDAIMMVGIDYKLVKMMEIAGFGTAKVQATVTLKVVDREAKKLFKVFVYDKSDAKIKFAFGGAFDAKELKPLVKEATDKVLVKMDAKIKKKNAK